MRNQNPYRVLVSEVMLQQTQVARVEQKYRAFLARFPSTRALAHAPLRDVLALWQGLGYNRRAKLLHECARFVTKERGGRFPRTPAELCALPGVGPYTAGAVAAFAFGAAVPIIETNIRSVYLHHYFAGETDVDDAAIMPIIARHVRGQDPRTWYYALMDYGAYIKRTYGNPNSRSTSYVRQSPFVGSDRQVRGALVRTLAARSMDRRGLHEALAFDASRIDAQLKQLERESLVVCRRGRYSLPG